MLSSAPTAVIGKQMKSRYGNWIKKQAPGSLAEFDPPSLLKGFAAGVEEEGQRIRRELIIWLARNGGWRRVPLLNANEFKAALQKIIPEKPR